MWRRSSPPEAAAANSSRTPVKSTRGDNTPANPQSRIPVSVPDALVAEATPRIPELAGRLLAHLDDPATGPVYKQFFYGSTEKNLEVPPRSGYLVGWRIAEALGKTRSLAQLAALTPAESRALVERALRELQAGARDAGPGPGSTGKSR